VPNTPKPRKREQLKRTQPMTEKTYQEFREAWARLSTTQKARVVLKQQWERRSRFAIFVDWSSLFDPEREQDADELKACEALIAERPELFPKAEEARNAEKAASDG
jgi:hypothetical protein